MGNYGSNTYPLRPGTRQNAGRMRVLESLPLSGNIIFAADFASSITPSTGASGTLSRASAVNYTNTIAVTQGLTSVVSAATNTPAIPAYAFGGSANSPGLQIAGSRQNLILQSNALTNAAWTVVGSLVTRTSIGSPHNAPNGTNATQLITSAINSGLTQSSAVTAISKTFIASIYIKGTFGNTAYTLTVAGTGGTPETTTVSGTTSGTNWSRVTVAKTFSAAATGNATMSITLDANGGNACVAMAQLEQADAAGVLSLTRNAQPSPYIDTTAATVTTSADNLSFPSSNINTALGTISVWVTPPCANTDMKVGTGMYAFSMSDDVLSFYPYASGIQANYNGVSVPSATTYSANVPMQIIFTFDDVNNSLVVYKNGASIGSSAAAITAPAAAAITFGSDSSFHGNTFLDGIIGKSRIWNAVLSAAQCAQVFEIERTEYGV